MRAPQSESLWVLVAADGCVCSCVVVCSCEGDHFTASVMLQCVGLDRRRRVVQSVRVVCGLSGERARVGQRSCSTVTEKPVAGTPEMKEICYI